MAAVGADLRQVCGANAFSCGRLCDGAQGESGGSVSVLVASSRREESLIRLCGVRMCGMRRRSVM